MEPEPSTYPIIDLSGFPIASIQMQDESPANNEPATVTIFDLEGNKLFQLEAAVSQEPMTNGGFRPVVKFNIAIEFEEGEI